MTIVIKMRRKKLLSLSLCMFNIYTAAAFDMNWLLILDILDMRNRKSETFFIKHHKKNKSHVFVIPLNAFTAAAHTDTHTFSDKRHRIQFKVIVILKQNQQFFQKTLNYK